MLVHLTVIIRTASYMDSAVDSVIEYVGSVPEALRGLREGYYGIDEEGEVYVK